MLVDGVPDTHGARRNQAARGARGERPRRTAASASARSCVCSTTALNEAQLPDDALRLRDHGAALRAVAGEAGVRRRSWALREQEGVATSARQPQRPAWMDVVEARRNAAVYMMSPGAAIYRHVCINCHGPNADGKGLQADLLAATSKVRRGRPTSGLGLFGPPEHAARRTRSQPSTSRSPATRRRRTLWGSRYMAWMALGGTLKRIPQDILQLVAATPILGHPRDEIATHPWLDDADRQHAEPGEGVVRDDAAGTESSVPIQAVRFKQLESRCADRTRLTTTADSPLISEQLRQGDVGAPLQ